MARNTYQKQLEELRADVSAMAELALSRYEESIEVLGTGDPQAARAIIEADSELNQWYLYIEGDCVELLALQQPVASDLRFIASSFKIVTDLERIGDLATNLARYGREAEGELFETVEITPIATHASEMVTDAMEAYANDDSEAARTVAKRDEALDRRCKEASEEVVRNLITATNADRMDPEEIEATLEAVSRALLTIRDIERVGDHAVNICARTLYMIENDDELIY